MKKHTYRTLAFAVSAIFGTGVLLAAEDKTPRQDPAKPNTAIEPAKGDNAPAGGQQAGHAVEHEIVQQLKQFAQDPKTAPDKLFVLNTALGGMCEVKLSQEAEQKAENDQVKQLARKLVQDHQQANQRFMAVAKELGVQIPQTLPQMKLEEIAIMCSLSGRDFDQQYVAHVNAAHAKDVACFRAVSSLSNNAQVKQFASETLPTLQQHHQMTKQLAGALGITGPGDDAVPAGARLPGSGAGNPQGITPKGDSGNTGDKPKQ